MHKWKCDWRQSETNDYCRTETVEGKKKKMDRDNLDDGREEVDKGREMGHRERKIVGKCKI